MSKELQSFHLSQGQDPWAMSPGYDSIHSFQLISSGKNKALRNSDYWLIFVFCASGAFLFLWMAGQNSLF